ncbi:flagellar FlbD family protein [Alicyclobacillus tolerans]|uniref:Flagellar protein FlbD n=1 Tax=Alicyclobacillus tolerans TaxID=90970 RepID=A0A1M6RPN5_9BACL|nr:MULTISPECIES: flagellar FlbD family protein [Alicyclobacillus]QRF23714.1 flagellar FlbD family protein [Alicyclobacillus sp. TC]SHK34419.1 flagellar protein FlbD [Alicyclobacillus montanus]
MEAVELIALKRINGSDLWLNPILIESIEKTPDTIITLTNGHKYVIHESPEEVTQRVAAFLQQVGMLGMVARRGESV